MKHKNFNINLRFLSILLFSIAAVTMLVAGINIYQVNTCMQEQAQIEENRWKCELQSQALANASDRLTSEVWHFVVTQKIAYLENYWEEVYVTKSRENAANALIELSLTPEEEALIFTAKKESDRLIQKEAWAMRLTAESANLSPSILPEAVTQIAFTDEETAATPEQKQKLALNYIFGKDYQASKTLISSSLSEFREILSVRKEAELEQAIARTEKAIQNSQLFNLAMLFYLLLSVVLFQMLAVRPFHAYEISLKHLKEQAFTPLVPSGSKETKEFANAFNQIYADWENQKSRLEEERFRFHVAIENSHVIVYEYLPKTDSYTAYGTLYIEKPPVGSLMNDQMERSIPDFFQSYLKNILDHSNLLILKGLLEANGGIAQLQIIDGSKNPVWIQVTATPLYNEAGEMTKLIGKITNIQSEKEKEEALENARNTDGLTGLYNKEPGLRKIQQYLNNKPADQTCCMMLLDMDNFEAINETEGTVFADAILQDTAKLLISYTSPEDILVRLGGDEFLLFIKDCPKSRATVLGPQIADAVRELSPKDTIMLSVSIGMCVTEVVEEYSGLYRCAESTLKYVKNTSKGVAACYLDTSNELGALLTQVYPDRHPLNKIDRPDNCCEDLISFALDLLGKSRNLSDAIALLMSRVGRQYRMDRISIIQINMEYLNCHVAFQWSASQADNFKTETFYLKKEELQSMILAYDTEGLCSRNMLKLGREMQSILHAAIWDHGNYSGFMSFERKEAEYLWSEEEKRLLIELARIISSFVLKAKADAVSQAKTDFLSRMSHEIRTPMNAITGMTTIAKSSLQDPERTMDCLNKIETANTYLLSLINDILDMSRIESGKLELSLSPVDIAGLTENLAVLLHPQAQEKKLEFQVLHDFTDTVYVLADELHLNQVLVNLLGNAVKFTPPGGQVSLHTKIVSRNRQNTTIRFSVTDTGIGIEKEAQSRIFHAFEQASSATVSSYGGTGLGLSISSNLVQMMGGTLEVESEPQRGSKFYFTLCFQNAPAETFPIRPQKEAVLESAYDPRGQRILLVEDNSMNQEIASEILNLNGFTVETAGNGSIALEQFMKNPPYWYQAILMDIRMPVMDGIEATRKIRTLGKADSRSIPIIAMTANAFDEDMRQSLENGMNGHLTKPIEVDKLLETLKQCITHPSNTQKKNHSI